jgi:hypothetical protein
MLLQFTFLGRGGGSEAPQVELSDVVLTTRVLDRPYLLWRSPPLPRRAHPVLELSRR